MLLNSVGEGWIGALHYYVEVEGFTIIALVKKVLKFSRNKYPSLSRETHSTEFVIIRILIQEYLVSTLLASVQLHRK